MSFSLRGPERPHFGPPLLLHLSSVGGPRFLPPNELPMSLSFPSSRLAEALARAGRHGLENRPGPGSARSPFSPATPLSIAFSRQVGAHGTSVAREVGKILGWPVYDQELLRQVARQMHVASDRVARVDEKPVSWL